MLKLQLDPPVDQLRQFSWAALFGFPAIGAVIHYWRGWAPEWVFWLLTGIGITVFAAARLGAWPVVRWVFVALMIVALPIGLVISLVLLGLLYFLMFTPLALFFKLTGRDSMKRKIDPEAPTYWEVREGRSAAKRYLRMY